MANKRNKNENVAPRVYASCENDEHMDEIRFKKGGRVDLRHAPEGTRFVSTPVKNWDYVKAMNYDPRFVMKHIYSATESLSFFVLVKDSAAPSIRRLHKTDAQRDERYHKRVVLCADAQNEEYDVDTEADDACERASHDTSTEFEDATSSDAITKVTCEEICAELSRWDEESRRFNAAHPRAKKRTACYADIFRYYLMGEHDPEHKLDAILAMPRATLSNAVDKFRKWAQAEYAN